MPSMVQLSTERLLLKCVTPTLIGELFAQNSLMEYFQFEEEGYQALKQMYDNGMEMNNITQHYFLVCEKTSGRVMGECGFHTWNQKHKRAEFFYSLRQDSDKRQGFMTEAVGAILGYGFNQLEINRVAALVAADNIPSLALLRRYGFVKEGTMREDYVVDGVSEDSDCYSLLRREWLGTQRK